MGRGSPLRGHEASQPAGKTNRHAHSQMIKLGNSFTLPVHCARTHGRTATGARPVVSNQVVKALQPDKPFYLVACYLKK